MPRVDFGLEIAMNGALRHAASSLQDAMVVLRPSAPGKKYKWSSFDSIPQVHITRSGQTDPISPAMQRIKI